VLEEQLGYSRYSSLAAVEAVDLCRRNGWGYDRIELLPGARWFLVYEIGEGERIMLLPHATEELQADLQAGQLSDDALEMVESCNIPAPTGVPALGKRSWPRTRLAWAAVKVAWRAAWREGRRHD
jgi:hypothetical protein